MNTEATPHQPRPCIYLAGPINGCTDSECKDWREWVKQRWPGTCLDPMLRDARDKTMTQELAAEIVLADLADIRAADAILVYWDRPSVGTSMEIFYAAFCLPGAGVFGSKPVFLINASGKPIESPWLLHYASYITEGPMPTEAMLRHMMAILAGY